VDDVSISLEHVDLLNSLDGLNIELLECCLQLLVIHSRALVDLLDLSSRCALSTVPHLSAYLGIVPVFHILAASWDGEIYIRRSCRRTTLYVPYDWG
jgi:hypothetical protein